MRYQVLHFLKWGIRHYKFHKTPCCKKLHVKALTLNRKWGSTEFKSSHGLIEICINYSPMDVRERQILNFLTFHSGGISCIRKLSNQTFRYFQKGFLRLVDCTCLQKPEALLENDPSFLIFGITKKINIQ